MAKIIKVKNTGAQDVWAGMTIELDAYYTIQDSELEVWKTSTKVFSDISSGVLVVNDGAADIVDVLDGWEYLRGGVVVVKDDPSILSPSQHVKTVAVTKREGSSFIAVSHDFTDKTTWYQESTKVMDEALTLDTGKIYNSANTFWIDSNHGKIYMEDSLTMDGTPMIQGGTLKYTPTVKDDGVTLTEDTDYTIDHVTGKVTFEVGYTIIGALTATYYYAGSSNFTLAPMAGKMIHIEHSELQFTNDLVMTTPVNFDIWVYNPMDLPNKVLYKPTIYKNIKDIINAANLGTGTIAPVDVLTNPVSVFPFDYATLKTLRSADGAELRISLKDDVAFTGEWGTVTFYVLSEDE